MSRTRQVDVPDVAALDALRGLPDGRLIQVPGLPPFRWYAELPGPRKAIPAELHPRFGSYTLVGAFSADALDPSDPNDLVTADLPADFALTPAETGHARLTANGMELWSGDGTAVVAESGIAFGFTGLDDASPSDDDRYVVLARHRWADDGGLGLAADRVRFSVRLSARDMAVLYHGARSEAHPTVGFNLVTDIAGNAVGEFLNNMPRVELWERIGWQHSVSTVDGSMGVERYWGGDPAVALGNLSIGRRRANWSAVVEPPNVTYRAANGNAASTAIVKLYVRDLFIFQEGV